MHGDGGTGRGVGARVRAALAPLIGLAAVIIIFLAIPPHAPITIWDLRNVAVQTVVVGIAAAGMTLIIISGGIDLSVGSAIALSSVATAYALRWWEDPFAACGFAMLVGASCGLYNGLLITALRLPPFIATLGTLGFFRGVAKWIADSRQVDAPLAGVDTLVSPSPRPAWLIVAPGVWIMLAVCLFMAGLLRFSVLGRHAYAIGSNQEAARRCGIKIDRRKLAIYTIAGLLVGLGGFMQFARLNLGDPTVSVGLELDIIAAVVIGGASLNGGYGSITGTLAGAVMMVYLRNRCTVLMWPNWVQELIVGHIIIIAVAADQWRLRRGGGGA